MTQMPTESTVPHHHPVVRPDRHTGWPWKGATVPTIFTDVGPGSAGLSHRVTAGWRSRPLLMPWRTAMSVPTLVPSGATLELPGPPNWLNPNVPRVPAAAPEPAPAGRRRTRRIFDLGLLRGAVTGAVPGGQDQRLARGAEGPEPGRAQVLAVNDVALAAKEVLFGGDPGSLFQRHVGVAGHEFGRGHLRLRARALSPAARPEPGEAGTRRRRAGSRHCAVLVPPVRMTKWPSV